LPSSRDQSGGADRDLGGFFAEGNVKTREKLPKACPACHRLELQWSFAKIATIHAERDGAADGNARAAKPFCS